MGAGTIDLQPNCSSYKLTCLVEGSGLLVKVNIEAEINNAILFHTNDAKASKTPCKTASTYVLGLGNRCGLSLQSHH